MTFCSKTSSFCRSIKFTGNHLRIKKCIQDIGSRHQKSSASSTIIPKRLISNSSNSTDVLIIGGGVMGSSIAYFLKTKSPDLDVTVIERDSKYEKASSTLSVSSIRQQFSVKENILLSMWSYEFMKNIAEHLQIPDNDPPTIQLQNGSYFFMASEKGASTLEENYQVQRSVGAEVQLLNAIDLKEKYNWLNTDDLHSGCVGTANEGWFDPWLLLQSFRNKAISLGVKYIETEAVRILAKENGMVSGATLSSERDKYSEIFCDKLVNAAGPWAGHLAHTIDVNLPVRPKKRYVFAFHCPNGPKDKVLAVDTSGTWFRPEGSSGLYICGKCPDKRDDPDAYDLHVDYDYFNNHIWTNLAHRVPAFEELKIKHSWAGFYDYNIFDQNAILGSHPYIKNFYFANGFSGHGIQQSPAVGNAISELIIDGHYSSIDLHRFSIDRLINNILLKEKNVV
eukprot:gene16007-17623_t